MKKLVLTLAMIGLVGCGGETPPHNTQPPAEPQQTQQPQETQKEDTAQKISIETVINQFKADGLPIGRVTEQTAESDPNQKLGRPGEYIASAQFEDTRVEQMPFDPQFDKHDLPTGGVIEIFNNTKDLQARQKHIEMAYEAMPSAKQYVFVHNNILLRVEFALTPEQAQAYKLSLEKIK